MKKQKPSACVPPKRPWKKARRPFVRSKKIAKFLKCGHVFFAASVWAIAEPERRFPHERDGEPVGRAGAATAVSAFSLFSAAAGRTGALAGSSRQNRAS